MSRTASDTARKTTKAPRKKREALPGGRVHRNEPARSGLDNAPAHRLIDIIPTVVRLLQSADSALARSKPEARRLLARATAILQAEIEKKKDGSAFRYADSGGLAPWQVSRIVSFVDENISNGIKIQDFSDITRLSRSYFSQAFRESFGISPHAYVVRRRIIKAQEMMVLTDKPLSQIALDCGLADQSHLSRLFRRVVGVSPGQWRRQRRCNPLV